MDTVLALNNSPYYYFRPSNQRSIGYTLPFTERIVSRLADIVFRVRDDLGIKFIPGIQLGSESDGAVRNAGKIRALNRISEEKGIEYIVHLPDQLVPGRFIRKGLQQRLLGIVQGNHSSSINEFEDEVIKRVLAAAELNSCNMVMHLPNGPVENQERVKSYLQGRISDILSENDITMCIENCNNEGGPFYGDPRNISSLVNDLDGPYMTCFDYGHYLVERDEIKLDDVISFCDGSRVFHVHINDKASDKHLFLGERPDDADSKILDRVEKVYLEDILTKVDPIGKTFVLERNRPFDYDVLRSSVELLLSSLLS